MKFNQKLLAIAMAAALPCMGAHAQTNAELVRQIELLKAQIDALTAKVEAVSQQAGGVNPQEFNRLVQKVELAQETNLAAGFVGLKFKGVVDVAYLWDRNSVTVGFDSARGNGGFGAAMFEVTKESEEGVGWTLRLVPLRGAGGSIVHEASVSVPFGDGGAKLNAGVMPDYSGYEFSMGNQNPFITNNLLYTHTAAGTYVGAGMSYALGKWTAKWMIGQVDGVATRKAPGFAYRADYSINEYAGVGFSGVHVRTNAVAALANADLLEIDAYHTRGDMTLQGQLSIGRVLSGALGASGADARWWGLSGVAGYKLTPRLQALARFDYINNRKHGGGVYFNPADANGTTVFGPELDNAGLPIDPTRGANRYALTTGINFAVNDNTQWKTELRFDRSSGFNFLNSNGIYKRGNTTLSTGVVVSF